VTAVEKNAEETKYGSMSHEEGAETKTQYKETYKVF
jgi:hypothetical protein